MIVKWKTWIRSGRYQLVMILVLTCIVLQYTGLSEPLSYQRSLIADGHWWRLLSAHFVHLGKSHLWMNLAGFILVVALVWQHYTVRQWFALIVLCSLSVSTGLWSLNPEVEGYVGFSGTLHGLIIAGTLADLRIYPRSAAVLLALIIGKLVHEQWAGALPGSESVAGGTVLVDAHLYGAVSGALIGIILLCWRHARAPQMK